MTKEEFEAAKVKLYEIDDLFSKNAEFGEMVDDIKTFISKEHKPDILIEVFGLNKKVRILSRSSPSLVEKLLVVIKEYFENEQKNIKTKLDKETW